MSDNHVTDTLLDDIERSRAFFHALPEVFFMNLISSLENYHHYPRSAIAKLTRYHDFTKRPSATFSENNLQLLFEKFDASYDDLIEFLTKNFFVEGKLYTLQPELKYKDEKKYTKLVEKLEKLCKSAVSDYESFVCELSSTSTSEEKKTRVSYSADTFSFGRVKYKPQSPKNQKMYTALWPFRTTLIDAKKADSIPLPNLAHRSGIISNIKDYEQKEEDFISRIKSANGYMRKIGMPVTIRVKNGQAKLIVK